MPPESGTSLGGAARWVALAFSLVSLAAVVVWATHQQAPELPDSPERIEALLAALAVYAGGMVLRGERWWRILRHDGAGSDRTDAYALTTVGYMGNSVLPARAGDAIRAYLQSVRSGATLRSVFGTLIAERVLDVLFLLALFVFLAYGVLDGIATPGGGRVIWPLAVAVVVLLMLSAAWMLARRHPTGRRWIAYLAPLATATRKLRGRHGALMVAFTAAIWATEATVYLLCGESVGISMSALDALYLLAVVGVFVLIPSGPGYLGTFELALVFGLNAIDAPDSASVSYLLTLRFVLTVPVTIVGIVLLVTRYGGFAAARGAFAR